MAVAECCVPMVVADCLAPITSTVCGVHWPANMEVVRVLRRLPHDR